MNMWTLTVLTPEDQIWPITPEYGPQVYLFRTEAGLEHELKNSFDPLDQCPKGADLVNWLTNECHYVVRITEHNDVEHNA